MNDLSRSGSQFKTLAYADPQFESYLRGTFSSHQLAVPIRTLNVRSQKEEVTFEVVNRKDVERPSMLIVLLKLLRPQTLTLSVGTMIVSFVAAEKFKLPLDFTLSVLTILAVLFFHAAINLLNDFYDHMKGHDRINPQGGSRAIQRAWIPAHFVQKLGLFFLILSFLAGIPVLILHSSIVIVLAALSALAGLEFSTHRLGLKNLGLGEYLVFLLTGPFLTCGFVWATSGLFHRQMILLGFVFGFVTLFFYHVSNIENILVDAHADRRTWAVFIGIDRAKKLLWVIAGLITLSYFAFAISYCVPDWQSGHSLLLEEQKGLVIFLAMYAVIAINMILICVRTGQLHSPLSSELESIRHRSLRLHWLTVICMIIAMA